MNLTRKALVPLVTMAVCLSPWPAAFADQEPQQAPPSSQDEPANAVHMSLGECLQTALENNLDLAIARKDPQTAFNNVLFQKAQFDPAFTAGASYGKRVSELQPAFTGGSVVYVSPTTDTTTVSAGFSKLFNFGATIDASLDTTRSDSSPAFLNAYNPSDSSTLSLNFTLPLLKGAGKEVTTYNLLVAKSNLDISHEELRRQAIATTRAAEDAYWNLRAAREAQKVAEQSLKLSKDLYELNKKKVEVGTLAPIEITQAEANVASNVEGTINAKEAVQNAEDQLRSVLAIPKDDPMWSEPIVVTEKPRSDSESVDVDAAIATALQDRPEIIEARRSLATTTVGERVARKNARHGLDLKASVAPSGNNLIRTQVPGPDGIPFTQDDYVTGGIDESLKEIPKFHNYTWTLGLTYTIPVGNRAAEANYANAKIAREKQELSVENTEQLIRVDVRTAARAVESGYERIVAARKNVDLQQQKLDAEQKKFENGMSTSFEVFTFQTDLRNAQLSLIQALLDYNKALADVERAKGTLLEAKGLKLDDSAGR